MMFNFLNNMYIYIAVYYLTTICYLHIHVDMGKNKFYYQVKI